MKIMEKETQIVEKKQTMERMEKKAGMLQRYSCSVISTRQTARTDHDIRLSLIKKE